MQSQQFVDDYLIVVENDQDAWNAHVSVAKQAENNVFAMADHLRDSFEEKVCRNLDKLDPSHQDYVINIMREMLLGWGIAPYENLAREILARIAEGK